MPSWVPDWSQNLPLNDIYHSVEFPGAESGQLVPRYGSSEQHSYALRSFQGKNHGIFRELLVTGCRYAQIVDKSQVFQFVDIGDTKSKMKGLYYDLLNLRPYINPEGMCDDPIMVPYLGKAIKNAMSSMYGIQTHDYLSHSYILIDRDGYFDLPEAIEQLKDSLQQCCLGLMRNNELVIAPEAVQSGDAICILSGAITACALRSSAGGSWVLISGDCYIFAETFRSPEGKEFFLSDEYVASNKDRVEEFRIR